MEEVTWARPARAGPEWFTLIDIALSARDETRRGMPGEEELMLKAKVSRATLYRRLRALRDAGLLKVIIPAAPRRGGTAERRAVYEIPRLWITAEQVSAIVRPDRVSAILRHVPAAVADPEGQQVSATVRPDRVSTMVRHPPSFTPSPARASVSDSNLEGARQLARSSLPAGTTSIERAAAQATASRRARGVSHQHQEGQ